MKHVFGGLMVLAASQSFAVQLNEEIAASQRGDVLHWSVPADHAGATLDLVSPTGHLASFSFMPGEAISLDLAEHAADQGQYLYELTLDPRIDSEQLEALRAARLAGTSLDLGLKVERIEGAFQRLEQAWVGPGTGAAALQADRDSGVDDLPPGGTISDTIIGDLTVRNSLCVGGDCLDAEAFGSDTIRLKENNLRIHFEDTSASGSFASGDWRVTVNGSQNGDPDFFAIDYATANSTPFRVDGGAPSNALRVASQGNVGIGTPTPVLELHVRDGDSPGIRLEQDASSGFAVQSWDIVGNETSFFVRDATNGSTLPFRIRPGAASNALVISNDSNVGVGILSPAAKLHVANGDLRVDGSVYQLSSRAAKTDLVAMDAERLLNLLASLDLFNWRYSSADDQGLHFGPTAEDFHALFGLGETDRHISVSDMAGVALGAAQALQRELAEKEAELDEVHARLERLEQLFELQTDE
ncbi:tail fiber domain-containing protein [Wenzhouxiangella marina]|uniref:Uncharacterized protein n=1 Tax=Wenzhouxiangella marina TaxID=1579979 RepID=A0A0K0Y066_9GAMM|nr:tail fiber domain-containing protein [Wenzhouxiangella marina]AKS43310.1 hypothetical protein WM2015_2956 [Wenzhouxiangella marina]MBB6086999.1 hypothetical protein [Wenzhouxiangella marina]